MNNKKQNKYFPNREIDRFGVEEDFLNVNRTLNCEMDNYFNEDSTVKFDLQNGKIETICFCRDKHLAEEIALALNKYNDEDNEDE